MIQNAFADYWRSFAPGGIQLASLPCIAVMLGEDRRHPQAILQADACRRHQKLHGNLRRNLSRAHLLLDGLRKQFHQRQASRYPADAAVKPARQLIESVAEALLQLGQQPALFQRALLIAQAQ